MSIRLLNTDTLAIEQFGFGPIPKYAILSHRWGAYELTFQDVNNLIWTKKGFENDLPKVEAFKKIRDCCARARSDSFKYAWIDSCCIDKTSSAELSEAINSMYLWYYQSTKCYAYLSDVQSISTFKKSEWFMRGWTLQELLAPSEVYFVNKYWKDLGTKTSLRQAISDQTQIPVNILAGADLETASVAQRMSWASNRRTTRIEDRAYCLMGIFGINMPLLYGERERAFIRLQEEIMKVSDDHSLFAWKSSDIRGGLLATTPDAFIDSGNIVQYNPFGNPNGPMTVSNRGIHLELRFIGRGPRGLGMAVLHCKERGKEDKPLVVLVRDTMLTMEIFERVWSETFECIDLRKFRAPQYPIRKICIRMGRMSITNRSENSAIQSGVMKEVYDEATLNNLMENGACSKKLFRAARAGDQDLVWLLLTRSDFSADEKDVEGRTALCHAVIHRQEALIKMLLSRRDVNAEIEDKDKCTPLLLAILYGCESIVELLVERGADTEISDRYDIPPLSQATKYGHKVIVKLLLEKGAFSPLWILKWAAKHSNEPIITLMVEQTLNIEAEFGSSRTMLLWAVESGYLALVKVLIKKGADIEAKENNGRTPLFQAVARSSVAIVELLLENGAEVEVKDNEGQTPLFWAVGVENMAFVRLLVEKGAQIEVKDNTGRTLLDVAARFRNKDLVKLLTKERTKTEAVDINS